MEKPVRNPINKHAGLCVCMCVCVCVCVCAHACVSGNITGGEEWRWMCSFTQQTYSKCLQCVGHSKCRYIKSLVPSFLKNLILQLDHKYKE